MDGDGGLSIGRRALLLGASAAAGLALTGAQRRFGWLGGTAAEVFDHRALVVAVTGIGYGYVLVAARLVHAFT